MIYYVNGNSKNGKSMYEVQSLNDIMIHEGIALKTNLYSVMKSVHIMNKVRIINTEDIRR